MSTFYGIGVGPGDSELMTLKAIKLIQKLDILYTPKAHRGGPSLAEKISSEYFSKTLVIKRRYFPMTKDCDEKQSSWRTIAQEIITDVENKKSVGFVTLGDPSMYSTYSYLLELVRGRISVKTIAGISSFSQIAASISVPLALNDESLEVISATAEADKIGKALDTNENVIIMKVSTNLTTIYKLLEARNLLNKAIIISNASTPKESVQKLMDIDPMEKIPYFSTLFLKKQD